MRISISHGATRPARSRSPWPLALCILGVLPTMTAGAASGTTLLLTESAKVESPGDDRFNRFGTSVALEGDRAVVGSTSHDVGIVSSGSAFVFARQAAGWSQEAQLHSEVPASMEWMGWSVALSGGEAIVGAAGYPGTIFQAGRVFTWELQGSSWMPGTSFSGSDTADFDMFASSLSLDGDGLLVGAHNRSDQSVQDGTAYLFRRTAGVWMQEHKFPAPDPAFEGRFGWGVALNGERAVVTTADNVSPGAAYVYAHTGGGSWVLDATLTAPDGEPGDLLGYSVALQGDTLAIGAVNHTGGGAGTGFGTVYVFVREGGVWSLEDEILSNEIGAGGLFGSAVALAGDHLLVGATGAGGTAGITGAAWLFRRDAGQWSEVAKLVASDGFHGAEFGRSLDVDGTTALIGAPGGANSGVYLFDLTGLLPPPPTALELLDELAQLITSMDLDRALERALLAKVSAATRVLSDESEINDAAATRILNAFIRLVEAQRGGRLDAGDASELRSLALEIIEVLGDELEESPEIDPERNRAPLPRSR